MNSSVEVRTVKQNITSQMNWYNDVGQRVIKKEGTVETDYVNQFCSIRSDSVNLVEVTTNNIYVGTERVISSMDTENDGTPGDSFKYFYHTDHLGSTGYLTDSNGYLREHIEYTPWGETWLEQVNEELLWNETINLPNYMFTGKELDSTGLYYFGARYYDPQTSVWQSVDPILGKYLDSKVGNGGIFNSMNLGLYSYGHNQPVVMIDPNGEHATVKIYRNGQNRMMVIYENFEGREKSYVFTNFTEGNASKKGKGGVPYGVNALLEPTENYEVHPRPESGKVILEGYPIYNTKGEEPGHITNTDGTKRGYNDPEMKPAGGHMGPKNNVRPAVGYGCTIFDDTPEGRKEFKDYMGVINRNETDGGTKMKIIEHNNDKDNIPAPMK